MKASFTLVGVQLNKLRFSILSAFSFFSFFFVFWFKLRGCCGSWKLTARVCSPWGEWHLTLGSSAVNSGCLSLVLSKFCRSRPDTRGALGHRPSYPSFVCCSALQKGAGLSHLRLEEQHVWCLSSSSLLQPTEQRGSKALAGRRGTTVHQWNQKLLFPLP